MTQFQVVRLAILFCLKWGLSVWSTLAWNSLCRSTLSGKIKEEKKKGKKGKEKSILVRSGALCLLPFFSVASCWAWTCSKPKVFWVLIRHMKNFILHCAQNYLQYGIELPSDYVYTWYIKKFYAQIWVTSLRYFIICAQTFQNLKGKKNPSFKTLLALSISVKEDCTYEYVEFCGL